MFLWASEHGRIWKGSRNEVLAEGNLRLDKITFAALLSLLDDQSESTPDLAPFFTYSRPQGEECLKVQNYVGVISTDNGIKVEILPKLSKNTTPEAARELLVRMLVELTDSPFREGTTAQLEAFKMPLFELLLRYFLDQVVTIVRKGIARTYVLNEENLVFLRGKLKLSEHIRRNSFNAGRAYCEFDEYEVNRPINRLIKAALKVVARLARDPTNQQRCRELVFWFDDVPATKDIQLDFRSVQQDRLIQHYSPAMPLCRLILEGMNPLTQQGHRKAISMLFPMERVFEDYVAAKLRVQFREWKVRTQVTGQALVEKHRGQRIFNLRPDIELAGNGRRLIVDTKWKLLNQADRANRYGISQGDIYQLFAYAKKFLADQEFKEVYLIYPASDSFTDPLQPFWYEDGKSVLHIVPFHLELGKLQIPTACGLKVLGSE